MKTITVELAKKVTAACEHLPGLSCMGSRDIIAEMLEINHADYNVADRAIDKAIIELRKVWVPMDDVEVGSPVALGRYSDVEPGTVIARTEKSITVRVEKYHLDPEGPKPEMHTGGFAAHCSNINELKWIVEKDEAGSIEVYRRNKKGFWKAKGSKDNKDDIYLGWDNVSYDYNF